MKILNKIINYIKANKVFLISLIIGIIICSIKLPYYVLAPGGTIDITDKVNIENKTKINGELNLLYASEYEGTVPTILLGLVLKSWDIVPMSNSQITNETMKEISKRGKIMLENSIQNAIYVAYEESSSEFIINNNKYYILAKSENVSCPLQVGDEILEVDKKKIEDVDFPNYGQNKKIGDNVLLNIKRDNSIKDINCEFININNEPKIGIYLINNYDYETNPKISLKFSDSESGSSGGLMMALNIYLSLIDEDIIKGRKIAGTGTIDNLGNVGEIAGVKYKLMGADKADMDVVLVPSENYEEAIKIKNENNYKMDIVEVKTFKDAIEYLKK